MREHTDKLREKIIKWFAVVLGVFCAFVLLLGLQETLKTNSIIDVRDLSHGWVDENDNPVDLAKIDTGNKEQSIYLMLDHTEEVEELLFTSRNVYVDVYQDGVKIYDDEPINSRIFGVSSGTDWHLISLNRKNGQTTIELRLTSAYINAHAYLSDVYAGKSTIVYRYVTFKNAIDFFFNTVWIVLCMVLILFYILFRKHFRLERDFLYLSLGAFFCSVWCGVETRMWQFFLGHSEYVHLIGYISMMLMAIPFALLAVEKTTGTWKFWAKTYAGIVEISAFMLCVLHFAEICEFHYTLKLMHVFFLLLLPFMTKVLFEYSKEAISKNMRRTIFVLYFGLVGFLSLGIIRYLTGYYSDYAVFIKFALFILIAILMIYQAHEINQVFVKGIQSEFLKDMAMLDHLTKFFNRTGFADHRHKYEESDKTLGIVFFDINDLKKVNDNQGHEKGDELICLASSGISECFSQRGCGYRMGGDEFMVVLNGDDPQKDYEEGMKNLEIYCGYANTVPNRTFDINIADGFALKTSDKSLSQAMDEADALMYEKKKRMKASK